LKILGIETSCDDTAAAVIEDGSKVLSNLVASQTNMHERYGGIIPEIASREHLNSIIPIVNKSIDDAGISYKELDGIAVTNGPGLSGSLLIGVNVAKSLGYAWDKKVFGINHLEGHIYSAWLDDLFEDSKLDFPIACLIASGGHTDLIIMKGHLNYDVIARTRDDAAGEAFDKVARVLGLGFPGGPEIQKAATVEETSMQSFPRPSIKDSMDFSFSGLKTAVVRKAEADGFYPSGKILPTSTQIAEYAFEFQDAVVDCLIDRTIEASNIYNCHGIILGGGVAANSHLRNKISEKSNVPVVIPKISFCTDNGAMIGAAAYYRFNEILSSDWDMDAIPNLSLT
tara:strand:- start:348 stop:1370 length:1023 start_codon:yes stop_codon:yes gene_type:complete